MQYYAGTFGQPVPDWSTKYRQPASAGESQPHLP